MDLKKRVKNKWVRTGKLLWRKLCGGIELFGADDRGDVTTSWYMDTDMTISKERGLGGQKWGRICFCVSSQSRKV